MKSDKPQTKIANTMAPNICWPKFENKVGQGLSKLKLAAESIDDIHLQ